MTADDVTQPTRLSPMDVHRRLQAGLAEAVVSRAGIRHEGLNAFLRQNLAGTDPSKGALLLFGFRRLLIFGFNGRYFMNSYFDTESKSRSERRLLNADFKPHRDVW